VFGPSTADSRTAREDRQPQDRVGRVKYRSSCTLSVISTSASARQWRHRLGSIGSAWTVPHRSQARNRSPVTSVRRCPRRKTLPAVSVVARSRRPVPDQLVRI